jgi:hypothetical protein
MISKDPKKPPEMTPRLLELAEQLQRKIIHVILDRPQLGSGDGQSFYALVDFVPRIGESIRTQNGAFCKVIDVTHNVSPWPPGEAPEAFGLMVTLFAVLEQEPE